MRIDDRTRLIWRVRGTLGPEGHLVLVDRNVDPAGDAAVRAELVATINGQLVAARHPWADDRGLLDWAPGQLCDEPPATVVVTWRQVWDLIEPGITDERIAELHAAWAEGAAARVVHGPHTDMRLHLAQCAFYRPAPRVVQLDLLDLIGAGHGR